MSETAVAGGARSNWMSASAWTIGAAVASWALSTLCILVGALFALALEVGATRTVGIGISGVALVLMVVSYSVVLAVALRQLARSHALPMALWIGLAAYPLCWGLLMLTSPTGVYSDTPLWVSGIGLAVALAVMKYRSPHKRLGE